MNSQFLKLNTKDLFKGTLIFVGTGILASILSMLKSGQTITTDDLKVVVIAAISGGVTYFVKNLFTNSEGNFKTETKEVEKTNG